MIDQKIWDNILLNARLRLIDPSICLPTPYLQMKLRVNHKEAKKTLRYLIREMNMNPRKRAKSDINTMINKDLEAIKELCLRVAMYEYALDHIDDKNEPPTSVLKIYESEKLI